MSIRSVPQGENSTCARVSQLKAQRGNYEGVHGHESAEIELKKSEQTMQLSEGQGHSSSDRRREQRCRVSETCVVSSGPLSLLGAGGIDPFRIYPINTPDPHLHELMDHSKPWAPHGFQRKLALWKLALADYFAWDRYYISVAWPPPTGFGWKAESIVLCVA
jgi:hypothetical protein